MSCVLFFVFLLLKVAVAPVPSDQRSALVDFYRSTNGKEWKVKTNWMTADPCDNKWFGIACELSGLATVTNVTLPSNNLVGTLPSSLENLFNLQNVSLSDNLLSGSLSPLSFVLTDNDFTYFDVENNQLTGALPSSVRRTPFPSLESGMPCYSTIMESSLPLRLGYNYWSCPLPSWCRSRETFGYVGCFNSNDDPNVIYCDQYDNPNNIQCYGSNKYFIPTSKIVDYCSPTPFGSVCISDSRCCLYSKPNNSLAICVSGVCPLISSYSLTSTKTVSSCDACHAVTPSPTPTPVMIYYCCIYKDQKSTHYDGVCMAGVCDQEAGKVLVSQNEVSDCSFC